MFLVLALLFVKMGLNLLGVIDFLGLSWFRMGEFIELSIRYILLFPTNKNAAAPNRRQPRFQSFSNLEYPFPYCTHLETLLKVAEDISASAIT